MALCKRHQDEQRAVRASVTACRLGHRGRADVQGQAAWHQVISTLRMFAPFSTNLVACTCLSGVERHRIDARCRKVAYPAYKGVITRSAMSIAVHLTARSHIATLAPTRPWSYTRCNVHAAENEFSLMLSPALNAAQNVPDSVSPSYGYPIRWVIWI